MEDNKWFCNKCKKWLGQHIDIDYHENTIHPNFNNMYITSWWTKGRQGQSPYD